MGSAKYSPLEREFASALRDSVETLGQDMYRIHPKGTGVVCVSPEGIPAHKLVCEYLGEMYPPYRWCERQDIVQQAQQKFSLKPTLPDFYNILLERPREDPAGYGLLFVDASQKSNMGSTLAHSCANNCTSAVVPRHGDLTIVLTSNRHIAFGEEVSPSLKSKGLFKFTVDILCIVEWCIGKLSCPSIISYTTSIAYNHHADIYPDLNIYTYIST